MDKGYKYAVCPFYKEDRQRSIRCEGYKDGTSSQLNFSECAEKKKHFEGFCCNLESYRLCPIAQLALEKYDD